MRKGADDAPGRPVPPAVDDPRIRTATPADAELLWTWANDPETRHWSFHSDPISWETHVAWLDAKLADPATRIFVVSEGATPKAVVRFEAADDVAVVSIVVDPDERGRGWGTRALRSACPEAVRHLALKRVDAYIKPGNDASIRAFESAGFTLSAQTGDADALLMVWHPGSA
jgi:UDP-2,4-diacetamido-2,4,6-trideoxy-beta-L-altropyranose hydrolase